MTYILSFIILISIVVFVHEYGHYYYAKKFGVGVTDFSIGFGKEIFGFNDKHGTRWKLCLIPLGGYVKFYGDTNASSVPNSDEQRDDLEKSKLQNLIKIAEAEANKSDINDRVKFLADQKIDTLRSIN